MKNVFFHIGVPKSGTTFLQEVFFQNMENVDSLGRPFHVNETYLNFARAMNNAEDYQIKTLITPFVELVNNSDNDTVIISDETICNQITSITANRIAEAFPQSSIIITLRNQLTAIPSFYNNHDRFVMIGTPLYKKTCKSHLMTIFLTILNTTTLDTSEN